MPEGEIIMSMSCYKQIGRILVVVLLLICCLVGASAAQEDFDKENFKGLVLTTTVGSDQVWVR